jgi:hypothetical protein
MEALFIIVICCLMIIAFMFGVISIKIKPKKIKKAKKLEKLIFKYDGLVVTHSRGYRLHFPNVEMQEKFLKKYKKKFGKKYNSKNLANPQGK